jgi:PAS domain S-box-containing protein
MASNLQVLHVVPLRRMWSRPIRLGQVIWAAIPEGSELPDRVWRQRHRGILGVLWLHAIGIACFSRYTNHSVGHSLLEGGIIAATALGAAIPLRPRTMQASVAAFGLIASSAVLVHLSGGYIEFHFHFFVMVGLLALYQEWAPFLVAIGFVLLHHGVVGVLDPSAVYNHPAAIAHPWQWAGIHALFIAAMSVVSLITWRVNETTHALAQLLLTSAGEGIIGLDRERRVTFVNEAALKLCEWDPHPPIGEPLGAILSIVDNGEGGLASAIRERRAIPGSGQETLQRRHGSTVPIEYVSTAITERGQIVGTVLLLKDVTERQRLFEESERRRRTAEALAEVGRVMLQSVDSEESAQRIAHSLRELLGGASAALYRLEPGSEDLVAVAAVGDQGPTEGGSIVLPKGTGAVGLALRLGTLISTPNLLTDARISLTAEARTRIGQAAFRAVLVVPLRVQERVIGALSVGDREGRAWTDGDTQLAGAFADQAALALQNTRLYQRAEERARRLNALSTLTRVITSAVLGGEVFNAIARVATTLLGATATRVWMDDREARVLRNRGSFGIESERERATTDFPVVPYDQGLVGAVFATGTAEYLMDIQQDPRWLNQRFAREANLHAFAGLPLMSGDRPAGVLAILFGRRAAFTEEEKELMQLLADHAAIAVTNAELFAREQEIRVEAEASARAVRDNEERIRLIIETSLEAVITMDADGSITGWNPQAERVFGWAPQEVLGRSLGDTIVPERNREEHRRGIQHFLATGVGPVLNQRIEVMALHRNGREFPVELTISAAQLGSTVLFSGFVRDLTDRKRAERRQAVQIAVARVLAETTTLNEWVSPLLEAIGVSTGWDLAELWTVDAEAHLLRWGGNWHTPGLEVGAFETISQDLTFASGADVPGRVWATVEPVWMPDTLADLHPARAAAARQLGLRAALGFPVRGTSSVTAILVCFSRSVRPPDDDLLAVMEDVSSRLGQFIEQQRAQEALHAAETHVRQLQRLEAVGRLAGGVAHDFNNLLTVILGRGAILLSRLPAGHPLRRDIELMKKTAERAAALTKQLLAFSRKQMLAPKVLDLNTVVSGITTMLQRLIGEDIELVFRAGSGLGRVKADPGQIEQVIANLVVNARDAMPDGGHLTIETANVELGEHYARQHVGVQAGSYVMLGVSDTGTGMDRETQARVFEPFFTTKEPGKGTGLGLSTVYGIVKQSGGNIWVYSEPGTGTTFKVYLPLVHDAEDTAELAQVRSGRGTETILVVEDEDDVRALACEVLATYGYEVLQARTPAEALLIAEGHPGPVQLLLTDVVMPGMSGRMLAERLAPLRPEMKVLYMSGYTDDAIVHHGTLDAGTPFIQKPFLPDALAGSVRRVLDTAGIAVE